MGHTLAEKLLASHVVNREGGPASSERSEVCPDDLVEVGVDVVLANDITAPIAIREFEKLGTKRV
ncbi:unnamed protein product, partial [marine sediment metagenome]